VTGVGAAAARGALFAVAAVLAACATSARRTNELERALAELLARPELAGARVGVCVDDAAGGHLLSHDGDRGFATASNMKLVSAAVALVTLGADHRAKTELWARGAIRNGELHGDLVLRGHGDPTLGADRTAQATWRPFVDAVVAAGVRRVRGVVVPDDAWLGTEHLGLGWQWDYLHEDYAAPFGALCCHRNCATVCVRPGPEVAVDPPVLPAPVVRVRAVEAGGTSRIDARRALGTDRIELDGTIAADAQEQRILVAVHDAGAFAAAGLTAELRARGVEVGAAEVAPDVAAGLADGAAGAERLLHAETSPPYGAWMQRLLTASDNLYAEVALRTAARIATGDGGTAASARHAAAVVASLGVDAQRLVVADGSGLSRRNLASPRQLVALLRAMWASPHRGLFAGALPLAGRTGTLRARFASGPARDHVRAKTGFIGRVVCLSGFVERPAGAAPLVFSVMLNDFHCDEDGAKAAVDAFVQRLAAIAGWDDEPPPYELRR
jgi:D-alanyl-D-alanine carboxypeptidase/D-alanyl-D-alanine-endopeptidase (penicillin-binding protein 4)